MSERTTAVNNAAKALKTAIGNMNACDLLSVLILANDTIAQRAYDIQCTESAGNFERSDASYVKMVASDAARHAVSVSQALGTQPGR